MNRRDFCKGLGAAAVALPLLNWLKAAQGAAPAAAPGKPNIIFILFDDLGYGEPPGFRKDSPFKMPNLDRLAREGVTFSDAHSAAAVCTPTRYGVLTGRYPFRIGQFGVLSFGSKPIIEKERMTVASMMKARGYHTACFGKWHLGMDWGDVKNEAAAKAGTPVADGPMTRGFDVFYGYTEARSIRTVIENDRVAELEQAQSEQQAQRADEDRFHPTAACGGGSCLDCGRWYWHGVTQATVKRRLPR